MAPVRSPKAPVPGRDLPNAARLSAPPGLDPRTLEQAAAVLRCLGHPLRLRLLAALQHGERTVSQLQAVVGARQPSVSQHLMVLKARGIVALRRQGPFAYYWVIDPKVKPILECIRSGGCKERS